jgi:hypothetical protein
VVRAAGARLASALPGGFALRVAAARAQHAYVCNETHWRALEAVHAAAAGAAASASATGCGALVGPGGESSKAADTAAGGRLRGAFFVHVPYPAVKDEYGPLAAAVAEVVAFLVKGATEVA